MRRNFCIAWDSGPWARVLVTNFLVSVSPRFQFTRACSAINYSGNFSWPWTLALWPSSTLNNTPISISINRYCARVLDRPPIIKTPKSAANKDKIPPASTERTWTVLRWFARVSEAAGSRRMMIVGIAECHREVRVAFICMVIRIVFVFDFSNYQG